MIRLMVEIPKEIWRGLNFKVFLLIILTTSLNDWPSGLPPLGLGPSAATGAAICSR